MDKIKLDPETSALILIDLQHGIVALETSPHPASSVVAKAASLAATFRKHSSPVIYVRVDLANMLQVLADRTHGDPKNAPAAIASELVPASGVQPGDLVVTKRHWSAFSGTDLEERLKRAGVKTVVIAGITTNYGVESTARAAAGLGFGVVFVEDATTSISAEAHRFAFETIFPMLGRVRKTFEVIEALPDALLESGSISPGVELSSSRRLGRSGQTSQPTQRPADSLNCARKYERTNRNGS